MIVLHAGLEARGLVLWGERPAGEALRPAGRPGRKPRIPRPAPHPFGAAAADLEAALGAASGGPRGRRTAGAAALVAWLPTAAGAPAASSPLIAPPLEVGLPVALAPWTVAALRLGLPETVDLLCASVGKETLAPGVVVGRDLAFAATALRFAGALVARQQYVPGVEEVDGVFRAAWRPVLSGIDADRLAKLARAMPDACRALHAKSDAPPQAQPSTPLAEFVSAVVDHLVRSPSGQEAQTARRVALSSFDSPHDAWLHALRSPDGVIAGPAGLKGLADQVRAWQLPLVARAAAPFRLSFRLEEPPAEVESDGTWFVRYLLQAVHDPSLLIPAEQAFRAPRAAPAPLRRPGFDAREHLLASLGQASGIDARIEASLTAPAPSGYALDAAGAFEFLSRRSLALEQAGFGVLLPSWWTKKGTAARLTLTAVVASPKMKGASGLSLDDLVRFEWQVAVGGVALTLAELRVLAELKRPLVRVRGQWVQVSASEIAAALEFWKKKGRDAASLRDLVRLSVGALKTPGGLAFEGVRATGPVGDLLARLHGHAAFTERPAPEGFRGTLRPYQLRGYSWLAFLKECGLGACLADDMGLGKTVQTLALVQSEWASSARRPALLVCPTSVVGNWEREAARFTPVLPVLVHHGLQRTPRGGALEKEAARHALVLSSYSLLHRDVEALRGVRWSAVILDEAQNVKNPETKQARAARSLPADYRIALTGTPVENHVGDLWSLMEFLNPGFLGSEAEFKKTFFVPIQAGHDPEAAARLRRLTSPFVLRRLKTDKAVIADLPEKMEMKVYCTLTREQASLYAAVVAEAADALERSEGIQRKGVVLATLSKLKQVCNHPAQFLKDGSPLTGRSGKLARLTEMLEEVLEVDDRTLVFTQFAEMGALLQRHLQETFGREALFLHGGVPKRQRDLMVERFQSPSGPSVLVLSLKAGGTGLNLTRANHVFHFDRWWNPAVENQATDRAFRIGQRRRVQVHKLLCAGTLEEKIDAMIEGKKDVAERVVGTGEGWLTELTTDQLLDAMKLRPEAVGE